ncbi:MULTISPECIES: DinB family protein [unclassified Streptomyces]|uniref:DinB family protein n=1 Tax=unclassified Streptomyces TaxID=2593676 RepID=UPI002E763169|nr:DinB family protein [Streptomyces sp. JV184]MEE1750029.1 DinB family protein [Streptomyces sp. JV184]
MPPSQYPARERPAFDADERTQLIGWLDTQRATARWKCEELLEVDAHRSVLPSSPLMTMAGVMSHLRWAENLWFEVVLLGRPAVGPVFDGPKDADMMVDGVPLAKLLDDYDRQVAVSNEIIEAGSLDDVGRHPDFDVSGASLRWIMFHMIEETARHAGHLDAIREILDGRTGHY